jgi:hypothetical protein
MQGGLSVSEYCRKLKSMVDSLGDLGEPIFDRTLVLSILCGQNEKFAYMGTILKRYRPFPTFNEVKNDLLVEEICMTKPVVPPQALIATALRLPVVAPVRPAPGGPTPYPGPKRKNKNKKNSSAPAWPSFYNPWTCLIQMWPGAPRGLLPGSRPLGPQQQQHHGPASPFQRGPPPLVGLHWSVRWACFRLWWWQRWAAAKLARPPTQAVWDAVWL